MSKKYKRLSEREKFLNQYWRKIRDKDRKASADLLGVHRWIALGWMDNPPAEFKGQWLGIHEAAWSTPGFYRWVRQNVHKGTLSSTGR